MKKKIAKSALMILSMLFIASLASATDCADNWTYCFSNIGTMVSGSSVIFTAMLELVLSIVPIILALVVVGAVIGIFDSVLGGVQSRFK